MSSSGSECRHRDSDVSFTSDVYWKPGILIFEILHQQRHDAMLHLQVISFCYCILQKCMVFTWLTPLTPVSRTSYFHALRPSHYYLISLTNVLDFPFVLSIISTICNPRPDVFRVWWIWQFSHLEVHYNTIMVSSAPNRYSSAFQPGST